MFSTIICGTCMQTDNYKEALERLYSLTVFLYGGYYEPKSERDKELADELNAIYMKRAVGEDCKFYGIFNPKNAHLFTKEASLAAFKHVKIKE